MSLDISILGLVIRLMKETTEQHLPNKGASKMIK